MVNSATSFPPISAQRRSVERKCLITKESRKYDALRSCPIRYTYSWCALIVVAVVWLQSLQLVISCGGLAAYFKLKMLYKIGNLLPPAMIGILLFAASRRWRLTLGLGSILVFLWSVANHYTYLFSGNAITISILSSLGTAMNVLGGYRFTPNLSVILLLAGLVLELFLAFLLGRLAPEPAPLKWALPASALLAIAVIAACVPFVRMEISYEWFNVNNRVEKMGYGVYFIRETASSVEVIHQPAGYEDADLGGACRAVHRRGGRRLPISGYYPDSQRVLLRHGAVHRYHDRRAGDGQLVFH